MVMLDSKVGMDAVGTQRQAGECRTINVYRRALTLTTGQVDWDLLMCFSPSWLANFDKFWAVELINVSLAASGVSFRRNWQKKQCSIPLACQV